MCRPLFLCNSYLSYQYIKSFSPLLDQPNGCSSYSILLLKWKNFKGRIYSYSNSIYWSSSYTRPIQGNSDSRIRWKHILGSYRYIHCFSWVHRICLCLSGNESSRNKSPLLRYSSLLCDTNDSPKSHIYFCIIQLEIKMSKLLLEFNVEVFYANLHSLFLLDIFNFGILTWKSCKSSTDCMFTDNFNFPFWYNCFGKFFQNSLNFGRISHSF